MKLPDLRFWKRWSKKDEKRCTYADHSTKLGKVWHFLAHDDSWESLLVDAVLIIVIGKFILVPLLGFGLGTSFPLVGVVSNSMNHYGMDFDEWWEEKGEWYELKNITKEQFREFYRCDGFGKGDGFAVKGVKIEELEVGDIIVYEAYQKNPIIHRIIAIEEAYVVTKGDANPGQLTFETHVSSDKIYGKTVVWVPFIGWPTAIVTSITG